ncbi:transmembrane protein 135 homolog [Chironomus tepperi]|uniref:transmembrane protein 135 homolog n=1 Tax=Chironomus tepperi TaxID=113505 RepID=UPI00391FB22A
MAGNISKYFYQAAANKTCADFHHPGKTCTQAAVESIQNGVFGPMKFYFPLCLLPLLLKFNKWNEIKTWKEFLKNYSRCIFSGFFITTTGLILFCIAYQIFKGYYFPLVICLPSSIGAIFCGFLPEKYLHIDGLSLLNVYIEFVIKQSKLKIITWLRSSKIGATFIYGIMNSIIVYCLYELRSNRFWVVNIGKPGDSKDACVHGDTKCADYLKKEVKQTSLFAFGISMFKLIFPRLAILLKNPKLLFTKYWKKLDFGLFLFILTSNGLFKATLCKLNQMQRYSRSVNVLIAGLVSSLGYIFYPRYIIFTMGITTLIEVLYKYLNNYYISNNIKLPKIMSIINRLPICELVYMFGIGMTFQLRVVYPHLTNKFIHKMMSVGSSGRSDVVARNYAGIIMGLQ